MFDFVELCGQLLSVYYYRLFIPLKSRRYLRFFLPIKEQYTNLMEFQI